MGSHFFPQPVQNRHERSTQILPMPQTTTIWGWHKKPTMSDHITGGGLESSYHIEPPGFGKKQSCISLLFLYE